MVVDLIGGRVLLNLANLGPLAAFDLYPCKFTSASSYDGRYVVGFGVDGLLDGTEGVAGFS